VILFALNSSTRDLSTAPSTSSTNAPPSPCTAIEPPPLLLKGTAAVAEVARPEDVGLAAVATLLRRDADGNCYAEDSFSVPLKAESATTLEYKDHELTWFLGQTQPMFIGRVSL
jgi:hypothetical protein